MLTCRHCKHSKEFGHFRQDGKPQDQQNVICQDRDSVEPVWNWKSVRGSKVDRLVQEPAPEGCFERKERRD